MKNQENLPIKDLLKSEIIEEQEKKKEEQEKKKEEHLKIKEKNKYDKDKTGKDNKENIKKINEKKFSFINIEKEDVINKVSYISYNSSYNFICLGSMSGFKIFSLTSIPIKLIYYFQFNPIEPIKIVEMLEET